MKLPSWANAKAINIKTGEIAPAFDDSFSMGLFDEYGNLFGNEWKLHLSKKEIKGNLIKISFFIMTLAIVMIIFSILAEKYQPVNPTEVNPAVVNPLLVSPTEDNPPPAGVTGSVVVKVKLYHLKSDTA